MKRNLLLLAVIIMSMVVVGCVESGETPGPTPPEKRPMLTFSGGTVGGASNLRATAWAGVAYEFCGIDATVIAWPSVTQVIAVQEGLAEVAMAYQFLNELAYSGEGILEPHEPWTDLRCFWYDSPSQLTLLAPVGSPIKSWRDIVGKRVAAGKKGFTSEYQFGVLIDALGIDRNSFEQLYLSDKEAGAALVAGKLDAAVTSTLPHPAYTEVDLLHPLTVVSMSEQEQKDVMAATTWYEPVAAPPNWYHMTEVAVSMSMPHGQVTHKRVSEDLVYCIVKNYMEHPEFVGYFSARMQEDIESGAVRKWCETINEIPWHAGAIRYMEEQGWDYLRSRIPPESEYYGT